MCAVTVECLHALLPPGTSLAIGLACLSKIPRQGTLCGTNSQGFCAGVICQAPSAWHVAVYGSPPWTQSPVHTSPSSRPSGQLQVSTGPLPKVGLSVGRVDWHRATEPACTQRGCCRIHADRASGTDRDESVGCSDESARMAVRHQASSPVWLPFCLSKQLGTCLRASGCGRHHTRACCTGAGGTYMRSEHR